MNAVVGKEETMKAWVNGRFYKRGFFHSRVCQRAWAKSVSFHVPVEGDWISLFPEWAIALSHWAECGSPTNFCLFAGTGSIGIIHSSSSRCRIWKVGFPVDWMLPLDSCHLRAPSLQSLVKECQLANLFITIQNFVFPLESSVLLPHSR